MTQDNGASAEPTGLSQAEPQSSQGLGPSGFDPLRGPLGEAAMREWQSFDLGEPEVAWAAAEARFRQEAWREQSCADSRRRDAKDSLEQASIHQARADGYRQLAEAIARASVTFPASGIETEGQDRADGLGAKPESPARDSGDAPTPSGGQ